MNASHCDFLYPISCSMKLLCVKILTLDQFFLFVSPTAYNENFSRITITYAFDRPSEEAIGLTKIYALLQCAANRVMGHCDDLCYGYTDWRRGLLSRD